jgi:hypothetical protein
LAIDEQERLGAKGLAPLRTENKPTPPGDEECRFVATRAVGVGVLLRVSAEGEGGGFAGCGTALPTAEPAWIEGLGVGDRRPLTMGETRTA